MTATGLIIVGAWQGFDLALLLLAAHLGVLRLAKPARRPPAKTPPEATP